MAIHNPLRVNIYKEKMTMKESPTPTTKEVDIDPLATHMEA